MNTLFGRRVSALSERRDRMESELTRWLVGLEPVGTPVALRIRTFSDLRAEAARPRRRLPWLRPALSSMAALGSVVAGAGLLLLFAVVGAPVTSGGAGSMVVSLPGQGGVFQPPTDYSSGYGPDPMNVLLLIAASALAGCTVSLLRVRRLASRASFGNGGAAPAAPLPFRRPWRSIPRITWALGGLMVAVTVWGVGNLTLHTDPSLYTASLSSFVSGVAIFSLPVIVSWRYPLRDRSSRLLLLGTLGSAAFLLSMVAYALFAWDWLAGNEAAAVLPILPVVAAIGIAAGVAGRSESVRRPPVNLASVCVAAAFFVALTFEFFDGYVSGPLAYLAVSVWDDLCRWLALVAWMAVLWVGLSAWRARGSWGWGLVLAAGALYVVAGLPDYLQHVYQYVSPPVLTDATGQQGYLYNIDPYFVWQLAVTAASQVALLLALAIGLRPIASDSGTPTTAPAEPAPQEPAIVETDAQVAGEVAGH